MDPGFTHWFWEGLWGLLSPAQCAACDGPVPAASPFCGGCAPLLDPVSTEQRPPAPTAALYLYGGPLAQALQRLKYAGRSDLARGLAGLLVDQAAGAYGGRIDRVVPLPLSSRRLRERGYNQVTLLARPLARSLGVTLDTRSLLRVRDTASQAGLSRAARQHNVRGAFRCSARRADRVLVLDDVRTSGATLAEAAATLSAAGCAEVYTLAVAFAQA